jgi:hypothetical protein
MRKNRFEIVDGRVDDAITLELAPEDDLETGRLFVPADCTRGLRQDDYTSAALPKVEAFRTAIALANELKAAVVVHDPHGIWMEEWGELYRPAD